MMEENNIIPLVPMQVPLTEEEKQEVELFAGIGYTIQKIAILLEEDYNKLMIDYKNPHSHFYQAYQKGLLKAKADVDSANSAGIFSGLSTSRNSIRCSSSISSKFEVN